MHAEEIKVQNEKFGVYKKLGVAKLTVRRAVVGEANGR